MPVIERTIRPRRNRVSIEVPREFSSFDCKVIVIPLQDVKKQKYDFSDLVGTIKWNEDAVAYQRRLRDEW